MKIPCYYLTVILDRKDGELIAFPKIIQSFIIDTEGDKVVVQASITNCHRHLVPKNWIFLNLSSAQEYMRVHSDELYTLGERAKTAYIKYEKSALK